jgi:hypothetical protein
MSVIDLNAKRKPVHYTVHLSHHWDGSLTIQVEDLADDQRSKMAVAWALLRAAEEISGVHYEAKQKENDMAYAAVSALLVGGEIADRRSAEEKANAVIYSLGRQGIDIGLRLEPILKDILIAAFTSENRVMELEAELEARRIEALSGDIRLESPAIGEVDRRPGSDQDDGDAGSVHSGSGPKA